MPPSTSCPAGRASSTSGAEHTSWKPDLLEALDDGRLSDAVLDVFEAEPLPPDHPFWAHPRVTVFPHVAAPSDAADLAPHVAANIRRFLEGETPHFLV